MISVSCRIPKKSVSRHANSAPARALAGVAVRAEVARAGVQAAPCRRVLARGGALEFLADIPLGLFCGDLDALDQRGVLGDAPMRLHVAVAVGVENAKLHRIHADEMGELVHLALQREIHRGDAKAPHRRRRHPVGIGAEYVGMDIGNGVRPGQMRDAFDHRVAGKPGIGAAVEIAADLARQDPAVALHAVLDVDALGAARRTELHFLLAAEHVAHRPAGQHRAEDRQRLGQGVDLAAKTAADGAADEMQLVGRHVEDFRAGVEGKEQRLGRGVDHIAAVGIRCRDRTIGLGRRMLDRRHLIALFEHMIGLGKTALDVTEAKFLVVVFVVKSETVLGIGLVDDDRAGLQRLLDIEHATQRLVIDANPAERLERLALAVGHHGHDRLTLVAHLVDRERWFVVDAEIDQAEQRVEVARHIGAAKDAAHAGHLLGFGEIDAANPRVAVRAAQHLEIQHALKLVIVEIGRGRGDVPEHVLALRALADFLEIVVALVGEDILAKFEHGKTLQARSAPPRAATERMALMIGS
jgi:hypothetical protein